MCLSMNMVVAVMHTVRVTHLYKLTLGIQKADGGGRVKKMGGDPVVASIPGRPHSVCVLIMRRWQT